MMSAPASSYSVFVGTFALQVTTAAILSHKKKKKKQINGKYIGMKEECEATHTCEKIVVDVIAIAYFLWVCLCNTVFDHMVSLKQSRTTCWRHPMRDAGIRQS